MPLPLVDYHVHTARCGHASGAMERYVEHAIEAGLTELGFSDHLFMYWLPPDRRDPELGMAEWEHDFYIEDVERCRRALRQRHHHSPVDRGRLHPRPRARARGASCAATTGTT